MAMIKWNLRPARSIVIGKKHNETRKKIQGYAAAVVVVEAVPERAIEVAYAKAEQALSILQLLTPHTLKPTMALYCLPMGLEGVQTNYYFTVSDNRISVLTEGVVDKTQKAVFIDSEMIVSLQKDILFHQ